MEHSADDLKDLGDHVLYEASMADALIPQLGGIVVARAGGDESGQVTENALVESFVIHVRALIEFLFTDRRKRTDDGIAADLVRDPAEWTRTRGDLPPLLTTVKRRADKEIAHVTFARKSLTEEAREWGVGNVHAAISRVLKEFVPLVPEERVTEDWHKRMWSYLPGFVRGREDFYRPPTPPPLGIPTQGLPARES
jgi:hypothetical protein